MRIYSIYRGTSMTNHLFCSFLFYFSISSTSASKREIYFDLLSQPAYSNATVLRIIIAESIVNLVRYEQITFIIKHGSINVTISSLSDSEIKSIMPSMLSSGYDAALTQLLRSQTGNPHFSLFLLLPPTTNAVELNLQNGEALTMGFVIFLGIGLALGVVCSFVKKKVSTKKARTYQVDKLANYEQTKHKLSVEDKRTELMKIQRHQKIYNEKKEKVRQKVQHNCFQEEDARMTLRLAHLARNTVLGIIAREHADDLDDSVDDSKEIFQSQRRIPEQSLNQLCRQTSLKSESRPKDIDPLQYMLSVDDDYSSIDGLFVIEESISNASEDPEYESSKSHTNDLVDGWFAEDEICWSERIVE